VIGLLLGASLVCGTVPAALFCANLRRYRPPLASGNAKKVSVLIPARDEAKGIRAAVESVLASRAVELEVIVMDDASTDDTAAIVEAMSAHDPRVRLERAPALPPGWNGKQHACWALAAAARHDILCFVDADVRLRPEALARMAGFLEGNALVSGFPRQVTGTWMEWMLLPLIHFVLLGFLPLDRMRAGTDPSFAAGCGQFLMVLRDAYRASGGHAAIRETMHDGLLLPRLFRAHGFRTDLADLTPLATCRMYTTASQVWSGLAKNATEGIADPIRIGPISLILFLGQVLPFVLVVWSRWALVGMLAAWLPRALAASRFRQDWRGALLHPFGILLLLAVQWYALARKSMGRSVSWKARAYVRE
jgi:glycosyltransferase involved in cell wall biosynthesis